MAVAIVLLGGNIGDTLSYFETARIQLETHVGRIQKCSSIYKTAPWGIEEQNDFLNQAILLFTEMPPIQMLNELLSIEQTSGRQRSKDVQWGPRTLDIDMLLYDDMILNEKRLTLPHPRLHQRKFALIPLAEIAGDSVHPVLNKSIDELLEICEDNAESPIKLSDAT